MEVLNFGGICTFVVVVGGGGDDDEVMQMSVDILGTSCEQCRSMVQYSFTSTETRRLVRTDSPGRPPRLSHSS